MLNFRPTLISALIGSLFLTFAATADPRDPTNEVLPKSIRLALVLTWREAMNDQVLKLAEQNGFTAQELARAIKQYKDKGSSLERSAKIAELHSAIAKLEEAKNSLDERTQKLKLTHAEKRLETVQGKVSELVRKIEEIERKIGDFEESSSLKIPAETDAQYQTLKDIVSSNLEDREERDEKLTEVFGSKGPKLGRWMALKLKLETKSADLSEQRKRSAALQVVIDLDSNQSELDSLLKTEETLATSPKFDSATEQKIARIIQFQEELDRRLTIEKARLLRIYSQTPWIESEHQLKLRLRQLAVQIRDLLVRKQNLIKSGSDQAQIQQTDREIAEGIETYAMQLEKTKVSVGDWVRKPIKIAVGSTILTGLAAASLLVLAPDVLENIMREAPGLAMRAGSALKSTGIAVGGVLSSIIGYYVFFGSETVDSIRESKVAKGATKLTRAFFDFDVFEDPFDREMRQFDREFNYMFDPIGYYAEEARQAGQGFTFLGRLRKAWARKKLRSQFEKRVLKNKQLQERYLGISPATVLASTYKDFCIASLGALPSSAE